MPTNTWLLTINVADVFRNEDMTFEQRRDAIVQRIHASGWIAEDDYTLGDLVDELGDAADTDDFDAVWDEIYNQADADRVWIATF